MTEYNGTNSFSENLLLRVVANEQVQIPRGILKSPYFSVIATTKAWLKNPKVVLFLIVKAAGFFSSNHMASHQLKRNNFLSVCLPTRHTQTNWPMHTQFILFQSVFQVFIPAVACTKLQEDGHLVSLSTGPKGQVTQITKKHILCPGFEIRVAAVPSIQWEEMEFCLWPSYKMKTYEYIQQQHVFTDSLSLLYP